MMKSLQYSVCIVLLISAASVILFAQPVQRQDSTAVKSDSVVAADSIRTIKQNAFTSGEYLKFDINYEFVTAGEAIMKVSDTTYNGRPCFKVEFEVNSKPFFNWVYKVEDRYKTIIDAEGLFPWRFEQHIREGGYSRDFVAEFDQVKHVAKTSEGQYPIPPYVQDMMSAFYFARTIDYTDFKIGQKVYMQNFYKDSTYELYVKYRGKQQIEVDAGTFNCIVVEPVAKEGGLFKGDGKVYVWLTDDERRMPVKVSTQIVIGSIDSDLVEYRGINGPIKAKVEED